MAEYRKLLTCWEPDRDNVGELTFFNPVSDTGSVRIGLNSTGNAIVLHPVSPRPGALPEYPVVEGYRFRTPLFEVPGVHRWLMAQFFRLTPENPNRGPALAPSTTTVRARFWDGTNEYTWDGAAFDVTLADPDSEWNTLEEIVEALPSWNPALSLGFVFELQTQDKNYTPAFFGLRLLYDIDLVDEFNDWLYQALVAGMADEIRPYKDIILVSDGTTTVDFGAIIERLEDKWQFVEVVSVFNYTTDLWNREDLLDNYNTGTQIITLSSAPDAGDKVLLRVSYAPEVAVTTDQDYSEIGSSPAILFERVDLVDRGDAPAGDHIMNEFAAVPVATVFPPARRVDIEVDLVVTSPLTVDLNRLKTAVTVWLKDHYLLRSPTTGETVTLRIGDAGDSDTGADRAGLRTAQLSFRLENVYLHHQPAIESGSGAPGSQFTFGVKSVQASAQVGSATVDVEVG